MYLYFLLNLIYSKILRHYSSMLEFIDINWILKQIKSVIHLSYTHIINFRASFKESSQLMHENHKRQPMFTFAIVLFRSLLKGISLLHYIDGALMNWPLSILYFIIGGFVDFMLPWVLMEGGVLATLLLLYATDSLLMCYNIYYLTPLRCLKEVCVSLEAGLSSKRSRMETRIFLPKFS